MTDRPDEELPEREIAERMGHPLQHMMETPEKGKTGP
jgi:hypothetical protein